MVYHTDAIVEAGGRIVLENLPFEAGTNVLVIISLKHEEEDETSDNDSEAP